VISELEFSFAYCVKGMLRGRHAKRSLHFRANDVGPHSRGPRGNARVAVLISKAAT
jgi:hypothetical protein